MEVDQFINVSTKCIILGIRDIVNTIYEVLLQFDSLLNSYSNLQTLFFPILLF